MKKLFYFLLVLFFFFPLRSVHAANPIAISPSDGQTNVDPRFDDLDQFLINPMIPDLDAAYFKIVENSTGRSIETYPDEESQMPTGDYPDSYFGEMPMGFSNDGAYPGYHLLRNQTYTVTVRVHGTSSGWSNDYIYSFSTGDGYPYPFHPFYYDYSTGIAPDTDFGINPMSPTYDAYDIAIKKDGAIVHEATGYIAPTGTYPTQSLTISPSQFNPPYDHLDPLTSYTLEIQIHESTGWFPASGPYVVHFSTTMLANENTNVGTNVVVGLSCCAIVTFANVTVLGNTTIDVSGSGPAPPSGYIVGDPATYYDVQTNANYDGGVDVCFNYDPSQYSDLNLVSVLHYENNSWVDVTTTNDTTNNRICGHTTSLSPFLIALKQAEPSPTPSPTPSPSPSPSPSPTPTPTPTPIPTTTVTFNDRTPNTQLNSAYSGINWGMGVWDVDGAIPTDNTNSISFHSSSVTSGTFSFVNPEVLMSTQIYSNSSTTAMITLSCSGNPAVSVQIAPSNSTTVVTNWNVPCSTVTVTSSNSWNTNLDNLVYASSSTATPSPTPSPIPNTLGHTNQGALLDTGDSGYMNGTKFTMGGTNKTATSMSAFVGNIDTGSHNQYQMAIYTDNNGHPGTLVANTQSGTLMPLSWNTLPITANLNANSTYWLMYNTNGTASTDYLNNMYFDSGSVGVAAWAKRAFGSWPNNFPSATLDTTLFSIYVHFQ